MCVPPMERTRSMSFLACSRPAAALGIVVDDPFGKADGAEDLEAAVGDSLSQIVDAAAALLVLPEFVDPGLDRVVAGFGRQIDLIGHAELLAADRAHVEAEADFRWCVRRCGGLLSWS